MEDQSANNKRIAKNTVALYCRMLLATVVGLYTSRVILATLGFQDYGIYNAVGGVVALMSFLNATMSGATSRFITYDLGKGDIEHLHKVFDAAVIIHIGIALIILIAGESIGLWFINTQLVIPSGRMTAVNWVYQMSIFATCIGIIQVPYNACIISHEKMGAYAYIEILNVLLKLLIVYLLMVVQYDKLILYGFLLTGVAIFIAAIYRVYCLKHFEECHVKYIFHKEITKSMLSFSVLNLYGNFGVVVSQNGINILINRFFGVILNAAAGIATTVCSVTYLFAANILVAFRPQIIKSYAKGEIGIVESYIIDAIKYSSLLFSIVAVPIMLNINFIMRIWLGKVPPHATIFCVLMIASCFFEIIKTVITMGIHATGKVKLISFMTGTTYIISIILVYFAFKFIHLPEVAYAVNILIMIYLSVFDIQLMKKQIPDISILNIYKGIIITLCVIMVASLTCYYIYSVINGELGKLLGTTALYFVLLSVMSLMLCFNKNQRISIKNYLYNKISRMK